MNFRSTVVIVFLSSTLKVMSDGHRFERGEAVCILCTPQMTKRGINSRTITSREQEIYASELRSAREKFPKKTKRICEACTIGSVEARVATTPPVSHWDKERRTWSKSPRDAPSPAQTPTKGPTSLTFDDTPVSKKARRSDEVDDLFQQLEDWFGVGWDEPQDVLGEPPNWELKWKHMRSRLGGLSKNFWFIPKRSMGDLNKHEEEALTSLVVRKEEDVEGLKVVTVQTRGLPAMYIRSPMPKKVLRDLSGRNLRRKVDLVCDFMEVCASGDEGSTTLIREEVYKRLRPPNTVTVNIPETGALQLQTALGLTHTQLRGFRQFLSQWGAPVLQGWRKVKAQRDELKYETGTRLMKLETGKKEDKVVEGMVAVIFVSSVAHWLAKKVARLKETDNLVWWPFIPKHSLFVMVHCDSGQGTTKLSLRLLNTPHPRSQHNLDILVSFPAIESYANLQRTCRDHFAEIEALHQQSFFTGGEGFFVVFFSSHDWKMHSLLHGHAGQSSTFFSPLCLATLGILKPGEVPGGPVLAKYRQHAPLMKLLPASESQSPIIGTHDVTFRFGAQLQDNAKQYALAEKARLDKGSRKNPLPGAPYQNITKGEPLLYLGPNFQVPAPVHCNIGITTDTMRDAE